MIKILLCDDSLTIQKVVRLTFMDSKYYELVVANQVDEARGVLRNFEPDVVLLYANFVDENISDFASQFRFPKSQFIILTEHKDESEISEFKDLGFNRFLKKPFQTDELYRMVNRSAGIDVPSLSLPPGSRPPNPPRSKHPLMSMNPPDIRPVTAKGGQPASTGMPSVTLDFSSIQKKKSQKAKTDILVPKIPSPPPPPSKASEESPQLQFEDPEFGAEISSNFNDDQGGFSEQGEKQTVTMKKIVEDPESQMDVTLSHEEGISFQVTEADQNELDEQNGMEMSEDLQFGFEPTKQNNAVNLNASTLRQATTRVPESAPKERSASQRSTKSVSIDEQDAQEFEITDRRVHSTTSRQSQASDPTSKGKSEKTGRLGGMAAEMIRAEIQESVNNTLFRVIERAVPAKIDAKIEQDWDRFVIRTTDKVKVEVLSNLKGWMDQELTEMKAQVLTMMREALKPQLKQVLEQWLSREAINITKEIAAQEIRNLLEEEFEHQKASSD